MDRRSFVQVHPETDDCPVRFAIMCPAVTQHVFGRRDGPESTDVIPGDAASDDNVEDDSIFENFDIHVVANRFVEIIHSDSCREKCKWLRGVNVQTKKTMIFYGDISPCFDHEEIACEDYVRDTPTTVEKKYFQTI